MSVSPPMDDIPVLVDTHSHLDDPAFDDDRTDVIGRARAVGVRSILIVGYHAGIWDRSANTAASFDGGLVALGVHPRHAEEFDDTTVDHLRVAIEAAGAVAIGETGIDLFRDGPPLDQQRRAFAEQLALAALLGLPTIVHQRAAEREVIDILTESDSNEPIVLHSFDAGVATATVARERGWYIGVGGLMTRTASGAIRDILREFPLDRLLLETDSPYLVPTGIRAKRNEPAHLVMIAGRLAALRGVGVWDLAAATTANAVRLFGPGRASGRTAIDRASSTGVAPWKTGGS